MTTNNSHNPEELIDILAAIETPLIKKPVMKVTPVEDTKKQDKDENKAEVKINKTDAHINKIDESTKTIITEEKNKKSNAEMLLEQEAIKAKQEYKKGNKKSAFTTSLYALRYGLTSVFIFAVLLLTTNYSAYLDIAKSYIFEDESNRQSESLLNSVSAGEIIPETIEEEVIVKSKEERRDELKEQQEESDIKEDKYAMKQLVAHMNKEEIDLGVDLVPYENRIVIPKIGKNIPLIDIKETQVEGKQQLDNIFMKELEEGVVRYPGSAKPGEQGNSFIFGHSSNFPWIAGEYNDVFSRLGQVNEGDIVFSYYGQKKFKYKITEKKVISPDDVSILKRDEGHSELTLMTCWPIGTTLNRLILIGELIEE